MFSVYLFIDGQEKEAAFTNRVEALRLFLRTYYRLRQVKRGIVSLRHNNRPILVFSGKDDDLERTEDI